MASSVAFFSGRRRHTRYIGDWSSDVCSSDLRTRDRRRARRLDREPAPLPYLALDLDPAAVLGDDPVCDGEAEPGTLADQLGEIGRAACREGGRRGARRPPVTREGHRRERLAV